MDKDERGADGVEPDDPIDPGTPPDGPYVPGQVRRKYKPEKGPRKPYRRKVNKVPVGGEELTREQMQAAMVKLARQAQDEAESSGVRDVIAGNDDGARQKRVLKRIWERLDWLVGDLDVERIRGMNMAQKLRAFSMLVNGVATIKGKGLIDEDPEALNNKSDSELEAMAGYDKPKDVN